MESTESTPSLAEQPSDNLRFMSPDEFFSDTQIRLEKIHETIFYQDDTKSYDHISYTYLLERSRNIAKVCIETPYVAIKNNDKIYVIDLNGNGFSELFIEKIITSYNKSKYIPRTNIPRFASEFNIEFIDIEDEFNNPSPEIPQEVNNELDRLNSIISSTPYRLSFDYAYNLGGDGRRINSYFKNACVLTLCLFNGPTCVSSIEVHKTPENEISISSFSNPNISNSGINQLMRAAAIFICAKMYPSVRFIKSTSINPISAYILINKLNGKPQKDAAKLITNKPLPIPFETINQYIKTNKGIYVKVDIRNPDTLDAAERLFHSVVSSEKFRASFEVSAYGRKRKRKSRRVRKKHITKRLRVSNKKPKTKSNRR